MAHLWTAFTTTAEPRLAPKACEEHTTGVTEQALKRKFCGSEPSDDQQGNIRLHTLRVVLVEIDFLAHCILTGEPRSLRK